MSTNARWYVVHTYSGYEKKVADNIRKVAENRSMQDEILDVMIPMEIVEPLPSSAQGDTSEGFDNEAPDGEEASSRKAKKAKSSQPKTRLKLPGYVFVKLTTQLDDNDFPVISDEAWFVVRNTRGVTGFVGPESKPTPLTEDEVYRMGVEQRVIDIHYKVGDTVNIIHGIFEDFTGKVEAIDVENNLVRVTVSALFGKETPVELELDQVEPLAD